MKCFLDMDGVLVDFDNAAIRLHNSVDPWKNPANLGKWGTEDMFGIPVKEFWAPMGEQFWSNLEWTKEGKDIIALVENTFGYENICLLTSPCFTEGSVSGKIKWINRHLPHYRKKFLVGFQKYFCAGPNKVLIDDRDKNIDEFREAGGKTILIPRPWNRGFGREKHLLLDLTAELSSIKEDHHAKTPTKVRYNYNVTL